MNLKYLRKQDNKTQEDMAKLLHITPQSYSRYELNQSEPNLETLIKLADYYGVSMDYLIGREFSNGIGYLNQQDREFVKNYLTLNEENKIKITGYLMCLVGMN